MLTQIFLCIQIHCEYFRKILYLVVKVSFNGFYYTHETDVCYFIFILITIYYYISGFIKIMFSQGKRKLAPENSVSPIPLSDQIFSS